MTRLREEERDASRGEDLLLCERTPLGVAEFLERACGGDLIERDTSASHTRAWMCRFRDDNYFVKWVDRDHYENSLKKDVEICSRIRHPSVVRLFNVIETGDGVALAFERIQGETLAPPNRERFFKLPFATKLKALASIFSALSAIAEDGWILVDFYEGNVIYNYIEARATLFDFELFERGDGFELRLERNYGSSRLMAPEEFVKGSWIDQRTNAFALGRYAVCALGDRIGEDWRDGFQGDARLAEVLTKATRYDPKERYPTVKRFADAFRAAATACREED